MCNNSFAESIRSENGWRYTILPILHVTSKEKDSWQ